MNQFSLKFLWIAGALLALSTFSGYGIVIGKFSFALKAGLSVLLAAEFVAAVFFVFLAVIPISRFHTLRTAVLQVATSIALFVLGRICFAKIVRATKNLPSSQHKILKAILRKNAKTEIGRKYNFAGINSREDFQQALPLSKYDDYEPYLDRMRKGEQMLLTSENITKLSLTSGTTGTPKTIPYAAKANLALITDFLLPWYNNRMAEMPMALRFAPLKGLEIAYVPLWRYSEAGITIAPMTSLVKKRSILLIFEATPLEAVAFMPEPAQTYIHLLFGLMDENLSKITTVFGGTVCVFFELLQKDWKQLANDIRHGKVTNKYGIPSEVIGKIEKMPIFKPNPKRADEIEAICSKGFQCIGIRLWPRLFEIRCAMTGAHAIYIDRIRWFAGPGIQLNSWFYGCSEGFIGMMMGKQQRESFHYTLHPSLTFFEFIPEEDIFSENPKVLFADQLQVGKRYEVVITSFSGVYRYRMGDILKVTGFYNETPVIKFCTRVGSIISLRSEKTTEDILWKALTKSFPKWKGCKELMDYTVTESVTFEKALGKAQNAEGEYFDLYYVIFVELDGVQRPLTDIEIEIFDKILQDVGIEYSDRRQQQKLAKPKIYNVKPGTFEDLKGRILDASKASPSQYKSIRYQKNPDHLRFLVQRAFDN